MVGVPVANVLNVVDHALGGRAKPDDLMMLSEKEIADLAERLAEHYAAWSPPTLAENEVRGLVDLQRVLFIDWHPGMHLPTPPLIRLLYLDSVAVVDPVSASVGNLCGISRGFSHWTLVRRALAALVGGFRDAEGLLASGHLILVPEAAVTSSRAEFGGVEAAIAKHRSRYDALWDAFSAQAAAEVDRIYARHGQTAHFEEGHVSDVGWGDRGLHPEERGHWSNVPLPPNRPGLSAHQTGFTLLTLQALIAARTADALPIPGSILGEATHRAIAAIAMLPQSSGSASPSRLGAALASAELPLLAGLSPRTLVRIREDESAFAEWRVELRNAIRLVREAPHEPGFSDAAGDAIDDMLTPRINELRRVATVQRRAAAATLDGVIAFAVAAVGVAARGGTAVSAGVAGAGAASVAGVAARALFPSRQAGANRVLLRLLPLLEPSGRRARE